MARTRHPATICLLVLLPLFVSAQTPPPDRCSETTPSISTTLKDPGFVGALFGSLIGGGLAIVGSIVAARRGAVMTAEALREDSRNNTLRELQKEFVYGDKLKARLNAELLLYYDLDNKYKGKNFEDLYTGAMPLEDYTDVAAVLNLFRLLSRYEEAGHIDAAATKRAFGWMYSWWWENVIEPYSRGLEKNPNWAPHVTKLDWLL